MNSPNNDDMPSMEGDGVQDEDPDYILTINDLYNINEAVTDGLVFVRDDHLLRSAVRRPFIALFGVPQFPTLIDKGATLLHGIAAHHLFADGNKRTAERAVRLFLEANGIEVLWDEGQSRDFLLAVAQGEHDVGQVAAWLRAHTRQGIRGDGG